MGEGFRILGVKFQLPKKHLEKCLLLLPFLLLPRIPDPLASSPEASGTSLSPPSYKGVQSLGTSGLR